MQDLRAATQAIPRQPGEPVSDDALGEVASATWQRFLLSHLHRLPRPVDTSYAVSAMVSLVGVGSAVAVLSVPLDVAIASTVKVLGLEGDELAPGDIDDAFAALIVSIGEGLQALLPGVQLGHPSVVQGEHLNTALPGARRSADALLVGNAGPVRVSLWRPRVRRWPVAR